MAPSTRTREAAALQERIVSLVRALGLHHPDRTPCGQPVPVSEAHALAELATNSAMSQNELAARLHLEKSTVSRIVHQIAARGWIQRERDPDDGRATRLSLTPVGRDAHEDLATARAVRFGDVLDRIPAADRAAVARSLDILMEALDADH